MERIGAARRLVAERRHRLEEIAVAVAMDSADTNRRHLRERVGKSPDVYGEQFGRPRNA